MNNGIRKMIKSDYYKVFKRVASLHIEKIKEFLDILDTEVLKEYERFLKFDYTCIICSINFRTRRKQVGKYCSLACRDESLRKPGISKLEKMSPVSLREAFKERLEKYIEKTDGCWIWRGGLSIRGYGKIFFNKKHWLAHRASWTIYKGAIPNGKIVCHSCDNPPCANPKHLFLGTHKDNTVDAAKKARLGRLGLTLEDLKNIKKEILHTAYENYSGIAKKYGLTELYIKRIAKGERWSSIRI